jgi:hypothetical protein
VQKTEKLKWQLYSFLKQESWDLARWGQVSVIQLQLLELFSKFKPFLLFLGVLIEFDMSRREQGDEKLKKGRFSSSTLYLLHYNQFIHENN